MYEPKYAKDIRCPLEYGLKVFGGKWKSRIICVLAEKKKLRYSALRRDMANISDAILAATLKELIADQLVAREQFNEIPPRDGERRICRPYSPEHLPLGRAV